MSACKLLQLLGTLSPRSHTGVSRLDPTGGLPTPDHPSYAPQMKISGPPVRFSQHRFNDCMVFSYSRRWQHV